MIPAKELDTETRTANSICGNVKMIIKFNDYKSRDVGDIDKIFIMLGKKSYCAGVHVGAVADDLETAIKSVSHKDAFLKKKIEKYEHTLCNADTLNQRCCYVVIANLLTKFFPKLKDEEKVCEKTTQDT